MAKGYALLERIRNQCQDLLAFIQQQHNSQIPQALIREARTRNEFQTFYLTKMCGRSEHMDVEKLRNVIMPLKRILLAEGGSDGGRLLLD